LKLADGLQLRRADEHVFTTLRNFSESPVTYLAKTGLPLSSLDFLDTVGKYLQKFVVMDFFDFWPMDATSVV